MHPYGFPGVPMIQPGQAQAVPLELPKDVLRVGEQSIWSTTRIAAGAVAAGQFRFFATPLGQQGQGFPAGLSISETNIKEGGRIPAGLAFDVLGIACILQGADVGLAAIPDDFQSARTIQRHGVLSWDFLQTVIDIAPVSLIGSGGGLNPMITQTNAGVAAAADMPSITNGFGGLWVYRKFPVALPASSTFNILMRMGNNAPVTVVNYDVKVALIGAFKVAIEVG